MEKFKVIIVEDVPLELKGTEGILHNEMPEADVIATADSEDAFWREFRQNKPDLVLLDLSLPQTDGQFICRELRSHSDVPIIVLTSRTTEVDEVMSMTLGADDFIPKPYSLRVLIARMQALLRRSTSAQGKTVLKHNGLELDMGRSRALFEGAEVELTKNELRILSLLMCHAGTIVSREAIMRDLWNSDTFIDDNTLTVNINRLRSTLDKIGVHGYLTTHRGQGYSV